MRKALIAGFFELVVEPVRGDFGAAIDRGDVIIVGRSRNAGNDLKIEPVKSAIGRIMAGGCTDLLVMLGRSRSWVDDSVRAILASYGDRCRITLEELDDWRDAESIIRHLNEFGLTAQSSDADSAFLMGELGVQRVYCVRGARQPSFERTLVRLGFVYSPAQFVEEVVAEARNSNLIQTMSGRVGQFDWVLYAWGSGLRTLPAEVKRKFEGRWLEADSPMKVGTMFKSRLLKKAGG